MYMYMCSILVTSIHALHLQEGEGQWMFLFLQSEAGELIPTKHQLLLDAHFELPRGI